MSDYSKLKTLVLAATPGPWIVGAEDRLENGNLAGVYVSELYNGGEGGRILECFANCLVTTDEQVKANAAFIAAANPVVVLELIAALEKLQQANAAPPAPAVPDEWVESLREMVAAMRQYEMDVDERAPEKHRAMMRRADALLNACRATLQLSGNSEQDHSEQALDMVEPVSQSYKLDCSNSPVIPDGCAIVPRNLTAENGAKSALSGEFNEIKTISCPECLGDDDCESCDGSGSIKIEVPVSWTTIKAIWAKGIEQFNPARPTPEPDEIDKFVDQVCGNK